MLINVAEEQYIHARSSEWQWKWKLTWGKRRKAQSSELSLLPKGRIEGK